MSVRQRAPATFLVLWLAIISTAAQLAAMRVQLVANGYGSLGLLFAHRRATNDAAAKQRAEDRFIDFVELMWPVLDPGQPFVRGWVQEAIADHLQAVHEGRLEKLLVNVPPGFTKSMLTSVLFPAWEWGPRSRADLRYMLWSYSDELTLENNAKCRQVIESEVYQRFWGDRVTLVKDTNAKHFFKNTKGGWCRSSSVRGQTTGFRADRLIWDDPHDAKAADSETSLHEALRWFAKALPTRVRNASGSIRVKVPYWVREVHGLGLDADPDDDRPVTKSATIGIMQRIHLHDISGVILKNPQLGYEVLLIEMRFKGTDHPARKTETWKGSSIGYVDPRTEYGQLADPIRFPLEEVERVEAQMMLLGGTDAVAAQFDQWPLETSGSMFKVEWLPVIEPHEAAKALNHDVRGWDSASSGSPTAARTASVRMRRGTDKKFYLMHSAAIRGGPNKVDPFMRQQHRDDEASVSWSFPRDPGAAGEHYSQYVAREISPGRYVHRSPETGSKETRAKGLSGQASIGNFVIVRHPGWEEARDELVDFPYGEFCDLVDASSRAFSELVGTADAYEEPASGYLS